MFSYHAKIAWKHFKHVLYGYSLILVAFYLLLLDGHIVDPASFLQGASVGLVIIIYRSVTTWANELRGGAN